jgi:hypothetical protein
MSKHRIQGNILFIVMFMLLLSSLIWLLIVNYVRQIFSSNALFYNYYQAYYLANAGIEMGLTKIKHRGYGFEDAISSGSDINQLRNCKFKPCHNVYNIQANHTIVSDTITQPETCNNHYRYTKQPWQNLIVPLFGDMASQSEQGPFPRQYKSLTSQEITSIVLHASGNNLKYALGLLLANPQGEFVNSVVHIYQQDKVMLNSLTSSWDLYTDNILSQIDSKNQGFLIVSNLSDQPLGLCIASNTNLPTSSVLLSSQGHYRDSIVSLQAIKQVAIPDDYAYAAIGGIGQ